LSVDSFDMRSFPPVIEVQPLDTGIDPLDV